MEHASAESGSCKPIVDLAGQDFLTESIAQKECPERGSPPRSGTVNQETGSR
jgi:hypothetical protein